jgi:DNA-directed RNA polymerase specialized sigma24 family protein
VGNLAEDVAARAVVEYWRIVERGEVVHNPDAMVTTIAKRRALNARRDWNRRRDLRLVLDDDDLDNEMMIHEEGVADHRRVFLDAGLTERFLEAAGAGGDDVDVAIAQRIWVHGRSVEQVAGEVGLAAKTIQNRMTAIKTRVRAEIADADSLLGF